MPFDLDPAYKEVSQRLADLKAVHPDARLRPVDPARPFWIEDLDGLSFICYAAACYRDAEDPLPAIGVAWEPFPGRTPYTKDSELMNAETSAWGRAIIACLRSESKTIASAEEVRNRQAERAVEETSGPRANRRLPDARPISDKQQSFLNSLLSQTGLDIYDLHTAGILATASVTPSDLSSAEAKKCIDHLIAVRDGKVEKPTGPRVLSGDAAVAHVANTFGVDGEYEEDEEPF